MQTTKMKNIIVSHKNIASSAVTWLMYSANEWYTRALHGRDLGLWQRHSSPVRESLYSQQQLPFLSLSNPFLSDFILHNTVSFSLIPFGPGPSKYPKKDTLSESVSL